MGSDGVVAVTNDNYVVVSAHWYNTSTGAAQAGAVTWGNGATGTSGAVTTSNSLVGTTDSDCIGHRSVVALTNGS